jgi:hypothetical protein
MSVGNYIHRLIYLEIVYKLKHSDFLFATVLITKPTKSPMFNVLRNLKRVSKWIFLLRLLPKSSKTKAQSTLQNYRHLKVTQYS